MGREGETELVMNESTGSRVRQAWVQKLLNNL